ncbi:MAG: 4-hydroxy-tetrahydrodipicolinate synthase [Actinomycetaceae bacterium]|nr:4-hydroxy-tetrahydrodipicolinate synthase [Actinomycetaceae bacterium]
MTKKPERAFGKFSVAMVTPFTPDGAVDYQSVTRLAKKLVADGCDTLLCSGTTGESPTTHQPEKNKLIETVREAVGDDVFIMAGAGSNDTAHAVRMAKGSANSGADGLLVVSPYYNRPSQRGLVEHCKAVTQATDLPVMLYDIPGRTGLAFSDEALDELSKLDQVVGVKDATGLIDQGLVRMRRTGLEYYSGDDALNFAWQTHGASGCVSVVGHLTATQYVHMTDLLDAGKVAEALDISYNLQPLVDAIMGGGQGAVMVKHALHLQGVIDYPTVRLPLVQATDEEVSNLKSVMREFNLL